MRSLVSPVLNAQPMLCSGSAVAERKHVRYGSAAEKRKHGSGSAVAE